MNIYDPGWLAGHMMIDPDGVEVTPGTDIRFGSSDTVVTFYAITRAPGDGTGTNGKIESIHQSRRMEGYPPTGYRIVPREGFDAAAYQATH